MKAYGLFFIVIGYVLLVFGTLISAEYLGYTQLALLLVYIAIYFLGDNKNINFLSRFKYLVLLSVLLFFFRVAITQHGFGSDERLQVEFGYYLVFFKSFFLGFVLIKQDRLVRNVIFKEELEDILEEENNTVEV